MDTTPRNQRERIASKGWRTRNRKLIALGQVEEHRTSRTYGEDIPHVVDGKLV